jgi:Flp pilus assembly pilin Flp
MKHVVDRFVRRDDGQDLIEYALLGGIITAALAATIIALRRRVDRMFDTLIANIDG